MFLFIHQIQIEIRKVTSNKTSKVSKMPKENKKGKKKQDEIEEPVVPVDPYAYLVGSDRDYIIKALKRVEKAPRTRTNYLKVLEGIEKHKKEVLEKEGAEIDPNLDLLITHLKEFFDSKDPRQIIEFNNYDNKFSEVFQRELQ